jgi:hypothetical protein
MHRRAKGSHFVSVSFLAGVVACDGADVASPSAGNGAIDRAAPAPTGPFTLIDEAPSRGLAGVVNHCGAPIHKRYALEEIGQGCALFDKDGDGDLDLYVVDACGLVPPAKPGADWTLDLGGRCTLLENDGRGNFRDVTDEAGAAGLRCFGAGATAADYDGDGDLDLHVTCFGPNRLLNNDGRGRFTDVTEVAGIGDARWSTGAAFFDGDGDGDLDLYVGNYFAMTVARDPDCWNKVDCPYFELKAACGPKGMVPEPDRYWINQGDGTFRDGTEEAGFAAVEPRYALGVVALDVEHDGDQDLYVANDFGANNLYRNDNGRFSDVAEEAGCIDRSFGMGCTWGDVDRDGFMDLYVSNMWSSAGHRITYQPNFKPELGNVDKAKFQFLARGNSLYRNRGDGKFVDVTVETGTALGRWAWGCFALDVNNDAWEDLLVCNGYLTNTEPEDL